MKTAITVATIFTVNAAVPGSIENKFDEFVVTYGKTYTGSEKDARFAIFRDNFARIQKLNFENPDKLFDINQFADLTDSERNHINYTGFRYSMPEGLDGASMIGPDTIPDTYKGIDYAECYTSVRDQGQCGSCWAFATAAAIEGAYCKKFDTKVQLSPQALVDCDKKQAGCNGANTLTEPFEFAQQSGIPLESDYGYTGKNGHCKLDSMKKKYFARKFVDYSGTSAGSVVEALEAHGPLSVGVAVGFEFQMYKGGVLTKESCGRANLNHAVTLVGYEKLEDGDYAFKIRNSWGGRWGEAGHIRIKWGACQLGAMVVATDAGALPGTSFLRY